MFDPVFRKFATMKLVGTALTLAALAVAALLGSSSAGVLDGPCTVTGDTNKVSGTCPGDKQKCMTSLEIKPNPASPGNSLATLESGCIANGAGAAKASYSPADHEATYTVQMDDTHSLQVQASGGDNMFIAIMEGSTEKCKMPAKVTEGACLLSDQPSSAAAVGVAGVATALLAAAGVVAANAQM